MRPPIHCMFTLLFTLLTFTQLEWQTAYNNVGIRILRERKIERVAINYSWAKLFHVWTRTSQLLIFKRQIDKLAVQSVSYRYPPVKGVAVAAASLLAVSFPDPHSQSSTRMDDLADPSAEKQMKPVS